MPVNSLAQERSRKNREIRELLSWLGRMPRSPNALNGVGESDCELLKIGPKRYLASTTDVISEEIACRLYRDPYTMGWMAATASISDLCAVGAKPLGLLFAAQWGPEADAKFRKRAASGLRAALQASGVPLLGGDTGSGASTSLCATGLGECAGKPPVTRMGLRPGDILVLGPGRLGRGPALGLRRLMDLPETEFAEKLFRPVARPDLGLRLRGVATAAIDTSDGWATSLSILGRMNRVAFRLQWNPGLMLDPLARRFCKRQGLPELALGFAEHGDFQLIFGLPQYRARAWLEGHPGFQSIGEVVPAKAGSSIQWPGSVERPFDVNFVTDRPSRNMTEIRAKFSAMLNYLRSMATEGRHVDSG
jgi:thiamine-monophosphate kinase